MNKSRTYDLLSIPVAIRGLVVLDTAIFLLAALFHLGMPNFTGIAILSLPQILPAAIVEGSIGIMFGISALALFTRQTWARNLALFAHGYALLGVFVGILALSGVFSAPSGAEVRPVVSNDIYYHIVMLVLIATGLVLLLTPEGKTP